MLRFGRALEDEKHQLQGLNSKLAQYLSRTKQLEDENSCLMGEINKMRQAKAAEWDKRYKPELRELRRAVDRLSLEKSRVEVERERLRRELETFRAVTRQETEACRGIGEALRGCEGELHHAHEANMALEQRLLQLEDERRRLEEDHMHEIVHLRRQLDARAAVPVVSAASHLHHPGAATVEDVQRYAHSVSDAWMETVEMYRQDVEEMERSIRLDQERLGELQRERALCAAEFDKLCAEAEKQGRIQVQLEERLEHMHGQFHQELNQYQRVIEELEHERNVLEDSIAGKLQEHQHLLQIKMDLGMEVAAYRALLEGERVDLHEALKRQNQHQRERIIDIKLPSQPYTPISHTSNRQHVDVRYLEPTSHQRRFPVSGRGSGSVSPSRVIPISAARRAQHQSPDSRRDMVSFSKAQAAATASLATAEKANHGRGDVQKQAEEERLVKVKALSQPPDNKLKPVLLPAADPKPTKVVSPPMMSLDGEKEGSGKIEVTEERQERGVNVYETDVKWRSGAENLGPSEKKILESVTVEHIMEKAMNPGGLEGVAGSAGGSKITYHVEKTEQEDGTTKTQIVLESKVQEELDVSEDSALDELFSRGVKKVTLEDIKGTATGNMIQSLLSGLQSEEDLANKSVNVEIIEEPLVSHSDEEYELEQESMSSYFQPTSTYFQIEELENLSHDPKDQRGDDDDGSLKASRTDVEHIKVDSVHVQDVRKETQSPFLDADCDPQSQEYFVSTPDDNLSEPEEGGGIASYGHYGVVDDLSDERYYQDEGLPLRKPADESDKYHFMSSDKSFVRESFPECIIEEEVHVSPTVQESVLGFLKEDSLDPREQLKGALEKLQGSVSGPLKEELAFLTRVSSESPQNLAVDVKTVQQSSDNGTMTIVAELNVSQTLEDSGLLEEEDEEEGDLSEGQILAALQSSNPGLDKALQGGSGGCSIKVSRDLDAAPGGGLEDLSAEDITEKYIKLGPSEKSFSFQMDVNNGQAQTSSEQELQSPLLDSSIKVSHEKRVATVYLESPADG